MIVSAFGGFGSSFLLTKIKPCDVRPDITFLPDYWPSKDHPKVLGKIQYLDDLGYVNKPSDVAVREFRRRSSFSMDADVSIDENLVRYVHWLKVKKKSSLLGISSYWGFFSRNEVKGVVHLVRHPLHSYCSWTKKTRHGDYVRSLGGMNTEASVRFYARIWKRIAGEALQVGSRVVRFEFMVKDCKSISRMRSIAKVWKSGKRNRGILRRDLEELLHELVHDEYYQLYHKWGI